MEWSGCAFDEGQIGSEFCGCLGIACFQIVMNLACVFEVQGGTGERGGQSIGRLRGDMMEMPPDGLIAEIEAEVLRKCAA